MHWNRLVRSRRARVAFVATAAATVGFAQIALTAQPAAAATVPSAPSNLTVTVGHAGLAELHWTPSAAKMTWSTANGTATSPADYGGTAGTVTIKPGHTTANIVINVVGDTVPEPNETFSVVLGTANGATIADGIGQATIVNDD
jgi:Calx-beta domain-containing protein